MLLSWLVDLYTQKSVIYCRLPELLAQKIVRKVAQKEFSSSLALAIWRDMLVYSGVLCLDDPQQNFEFKEPAGTPYSLARET